eukprot:CAMPEP_0202715522 /NCGR_PEP_ID=MMETSP1385-20130828/90951_1 /ASSEMBLY_ACC=CAM_ASM_000861 /TAXON_ID=933848 /ORGANISM="Elphidium margaritaceum" /LENGTH=155 /DNA_ID=CAMNT_0049376817 /DNA_START=54 /DNA_END=517 /DNA_ORIENTATION=-
MTYSEIEDQQQHQQQLQQRDYSAQNVMIRPFYPSHTNDKIMHSKKRPKLSRSHAAHSAYYGQIGQHTHGQHTQHHAHGQHHQNKTLPNMNLYGQYSQYNLHDDTNMCFSFIDEDLDSPPLHLHERDKSSTNDTGTIIIHSKREMSPSLSVLRYPT